MLLANTLAEFTGTEPELVVEKATASMETELPSVSNRATVGHPGANPLGWGSARINSAQVTELRAVTCESLALTDLDLWADSENSDCAADSRVSSDIAASGTGGGGGNPWCPPSGGPFFFHPLYALPQALKSFIWGFLLGTGGGGEGCVPVPLGGGGLGALPSEVEAMKVAGTARNRCRIPGHMSDHVRAPPPSRVPVGAFPCADVQAMGTRSCGIGVPGAEAWGVYRGGLECACGGRHVWALDLCQSEAAESMVVVGEVLVAREERQGSREIGTSRGGGMAPNACVIQNG